MLFEARVNGFRGNIAILFMVLTSGCSTFSGYPKSYQDGSAVLSADKPYLDASVRANPDANKQEYRDKVIYARIEVIDINYYKFESKLTGGYSALSLGGDLTQLVLNGLGATTGSSETKAALAAASAGVLGASGAVNTDVFYKKTLPALVTQMRADRQKALVTLEGGMAKPVAQYSLQQALLDVNSYFEAGTLPGALSSVTSAAGAQLDTANAQLAKIRVDKWVTPVQGSSAEQILAWLYPNGDETKPVNAVNLAALTKWMTNYTADPVLSSVPYQNLLTGSSISNGEADRQQAIHDLNIPKVTP